MKKIPTLFERVFDNHHKVGSRSAKSSAATSGSRGENDKQFSRLIFKSGGFFYDAESFNGHGGI